MIERHHLEILRAVERQGSLTAAAEQLHLTQSALSHAVRKLEQQLGTPVWLREGRQLRFTQAGSQLLGLANRLLPQFEHAEMQVRQIARGQRGSLRVGMECHPCYQWLLKVVGPYLQHWPDVKTQKPYVPCSFNNALWLRMPLGHGSPLDMNPPSGTGTGSPRG